MIALASEIAPFDIYLCCKESDNCNPTRESKLAYEIYNQLTRHSFKVFYAPITLLNARKTNPTYLRPLIQPK